VMNTWPSTLPQDPFFNFDGTPSNGLTSKPEESNNPIRTRTYPEHEAGFSFKQLTIAQIQTLRTFYDVTLNQTGPFSAPWLPDIGYDNHFLRLTSPPQITKNERNFDVQISVEIICGVPMVGGNVAYWTT
jgi:hypothetical protein